jgi:hypothetical protein
VVTELETPMKIQYLSPALMAAGLLIAVPAFAQTSPPQKQPAQESYAPVGAPYNAHPNYTPTKQPAQESYAPVGAPYNANPNYNPAKQ